MTITAIKKEIKKRIEYLEFKKCEANCLEITRKELKSRTEKYDNEIYKLMVMLEKGRD